MADVVSLIRFITPSIQKLVDLEFEKLASEPDTGSALDQINLRGGDKIIYEFLINGEPGMAFDHLAYMIEETGIEVAPHTREALARISALMS
ncbi:hypothetical protein [Aliiroseovarius sp. 2305UL8-7]|uniref:hypothetical protein n=1 Tax=Aliiroseovarius conchicola TaxID=3121637 RepID=UPI0035299973